MTNLSPAAQAVLDAFLGDAENTGLQMDDLRENVAAALRAVVECLGYDNYHVDGDHGLAVVNVRDVLAIATDLEAQ